MARRNGWELPAHSFQVMAITIYFLLSIAFYAFFAPFLGKDYYEHGAVFIYSFLALSVFVLYVRCTAIDPADSGIFIGDNGVGRHRLQHAAESSDGSSSSSNSESKTYGAYVKDGSSICSKFGSFCCVCIVKEDCRKDEEAVRSGNEGGLFCTLCNAEVHKMSKHCRSCDKCIDGFDHHCRWLNNCVGRKNYHTFLLLMTMSLIWLFVESAIGVIVLVRCFTDREATDTLIVERLGDGFSRIPFATVVALCSAVCLLATIPIGELFFFHILLIRKGITTYEYIMAVRAQGEPYGPSLAGDQTSQPPSPISTSLTAISGGSSLSLAYRDTWCTPPRIFIDHQDDIIQHLEPGSMPSTVDPETMEATERTRKLMKRPVRISAWKLAKLDSNEAIKAAAKARASSSMLRPINSHFHYDTDRSLSGIASSRSSAVSADISLMRDRRSGSTSTHLPLLKKYSYPPSQSSREDTETCPETPSSFTSPHVPRNMAGPSNHNLNPVPRQANAPYHSSIVDSPLSIGEDDGNGMAVRDGIHHKHPCNSRHVPFLRIAEKTPMNLDRERRNLASFQNIAGSSQILTAELPCTGQSIFYASPLVNERNFRSPNVGHNTVNQQQLEGVDRKRGSYQLPVFVPSDANDDKIGRLP